MDVESFIARWQNNEGGAERANYALFLTELCDLLDLPRPDPADANHDHNDYVFERAVTFRDAGGKTGHGRITSTSAAVSCWRPSRAASAAGARK